MTEPGFRPGGRAGGLAAAAVMLVAALAYLPGVGGYFLQDDFAATGQFFGPDGAFDLPRKPDLGFPSGFLPFWTHLADSYFWGGNPAGHHATNLLLHVLATAAVFVLASKLPGGRWRVAFFAALFFALCPLHENAVGWISGRAVPLAMIFLLVGLLAALRQRPSPVLAGTCYVAALLCHSAAFTLPLLALALDVLGGRGRWRARLRTVHLPLLGLMVLYYGLLRAAGLRIWHTDQTLASLEPSQLLATLGRLFVPLNEAITNPARAPLVKGAALVVLAIQAGLLATRRAAPPRIFWIGLVGFVVLMIPIVSSARVGSDLAGSRLFYGVMAPVYVMLAAFFFADTAVFRQSAGARADRRTLARAVGLSLAFSVILGLCLVKNGQAYAGAARLVRHVQAAALESARNEVAETLIVVMDPPARYGGAPVLGRGLRRALRPPYRLDRAARQILVVRSGDTGPLLAQLRGDHPPLKVVWMDARGLEPSRPFVAVSPLFPGAGEPAPFTPPRFAGEDLGAWQPAHGLSGGSDRSGFHGAAGGDDPWFLSPPLVIPFPWVKEVVVRLGLRRPGGGQVPVELFWGLLADPLHFAADRRCRRILPADGKLHTLTFPLAPRPAGAQPGKPETFLARLRLDPVRSPDIRIASITLVAGPACPGPEQVAAAWEGLSLQTWIAPAETRLALADGVLEVRSAGPDPYAISPVIDLDGHAVRKVEVVMKVEAASHQGALYWATAEPRGFREAASRRFQVQVGDGRFHTYSVPFTGRHRLKPGTVLKAIRIDPTAGPGTAWIKSVKVYRTGPAR